MIVGSSTSGKARQMEKGDSIQGLAMYFLATSRMVGDMVTFYVLVLMEQGLFC